MTDLIALAERVEADWRSALKNAIRRGTADEVNGKPCGNIIVKGREAAEYIDPEDAAEMFFECIADEIDALLRALSSRSEGDAP